MCIRDSPLTPLLHQYHPTQTWRYFHHVSHHRKTTPPNREQNLDGRTILLPTMRKCTLNRFFSSYFISICSTIYKSFTRYTRKNETLKRKHSRYCWVPESTINRSPAKPDNTVSLNCFFQTSSRLSSTLEKRMMISLSLIHIFQQWKDSVTIVVKSGDKEKHHTKISKNDFLKPGKH